jgi:damage-control phosphatase, subfamily III
MAIPRRLLRTTGRLRRLATQRGRTSSGSSANATCTGQSAYVFHKSTCSKVYRRRIHNIFRLSSHWAKFDVFARQKINGFRDSRRGVLELAARYKELVTQLQANKGAPLGTSDMADDADATLFAEMLDICLWGNATDLSLLTTLTHDDIQRLQGRAARKAAEKNILANDTQAAYELLRDNTSAERRIDFVLDNAGFELYADLVLAGYLLSSGLATQVVLHPKSIPWFVSDVMPADFAALLNAMSNPRGFFDAPASPSGADAPSATAPPPLTDAEVQDLSAVFQDWATHHAEGRLIIRPNRYWTAGGSFWRLPYEAKDLYEDLKASKLVIFKGDLNYRKLTADVCSNPLCFLSS